MRVLGEPKSCPSRQMRGGYVRRVALAASFCLALTAAASAMEEPVQQAGLASPGRGGCADVALVLAVDASGSIDDREYRMQQVGYASAFRDEAVQIALRAAGIVDVAAVVWGDSDFAPQIVPFHRIASVKDAQGFADRLQSMGRTTTGNTGLGSGIDHALNLLDDPTVCAARKIIDVSGDGRQVYFRGRMGMVTPLHARERAEEMGVTINALAILSREPDLEDYYRSRVITGAGAFVTVAGGFHDFGTALIDKLVRELMAGLPSCGRPDCG